jgi:hypothetical protein
MPLFVLAPIKCNGLYFWLRESDESTTYGKMRILS